MEPFLPQTSLPLSHKDQTTNPNSSSSSLNYPYFFINDDQISPLDFDDHTLYYVNRNADPNNNYDHNPNHQFIGHPPTYQDSCTNDQIPILLEMITGNANTSESSHISVDATCMVPQPNNFQRQMLDRNYNGERMINDGNKIALRLKTELEVLDDGYRWRKYGKKKVKSSPNLRNYYKCLAVGCEVKKQVERDRDDSSYVIATYIGMHNHPVPSFIPCNACHPTGVWSL